MNKRRNNTKGNIRNNSLLNMIWKIILDNKTNNNQRTTSINSSITNLQENNIDIDSNGDTKVIQMIQVNQR